MHNASNPNSTGTIHAVDAGNLTGTVDLLSEEWFQLTFTLDYDTRELDFYAHSDDPTLTGEALRNRLVHDNQIDMTDTHFVLFMSGTDPDDARWPGDISIFRLYDRKLTPEEIEQNFNAGNAIFTGPLRPARDFDADNLCNVNDINLMFAQGDLVAGVADPNGNSLFNLTGDTSIDGQDISLWLGLAAENNGYGTAPYLRGDTDHLGNISPAQRTSTLWRTTMHRWVQCPGSSRRTGTRAVLTVMGTLISLTSISWRGITTPTVMVPARQGRHLSRPPPCCWQSADCSWRWPEVQVGGIGECGRASRTKPESADFKPLLAQTNHPRAYSPIRTPGSNQANRPRYRHSYLAVRRARNNEGIS